MKLNEVDDAAIYKRSRSRIKTSILEVRRGNWSASVQVDGKVEYLETIIDRGLVVGALTAALETKLQEVNQNLCKLGVTLPEDERDDDPYKVGSIGGSK